MKITPDMLDQATARGLLHEGQADALWALLVEQQRDRPGFRPAHILYYLGGLVAIGAMTLFITLGWERLGGAGLFAIASAYAFAAALGAPIAVSSSPVLVALMWVNCWLLGWRLLMRAGCTTVAYGWKEGLRSLPRTVVANLIAMLAAWRALTIHSSGGPRRWDKTHHVFPAEVPR